MYKILLIMPKYKKKILAIIAVTPFAGVWIEMDNLVASIGQIAVTPFAGVWIEIMFSGHLLLCLIVTPFAGVWIEILAPLPHPLAKRSLPLRECGLK